jgi:hypothetical protein
LADNGSWPASIHGRDLTSAGSECSLPRRASGTIGIAERVATATAIMALISRNQGAHRSARTSANKSRRSAIICQLLAQVIRLNT